MKKALILPFLLLMLVLSINAASYRVGHDDKAPWGSGKTMIISIQGEVSVTNNATRSKLLPVEVAIGKFISPNHTVRTGRYSELGLLFANGATVLISANSELSLDKYIVEQYQATDVPVLSQIEEPSASKSRLNLHYGELFYKSIALLTDSEFTIETPLGSAGIRGTEFKISAAGNSVSILLTEGKMDFKDNYQQLIIVPQNKLWTIRQDSKESWPKVEIKPVLEQQVRDLQQVNILNQQSAYGVRLNEFQASEPKKRIITPEVEPITQSVPTAAGSLVLARIPQGYITPDITRPNFKVKITYDFSLGQYEVTQSQYEKLMGDNPSVFKDNSSLPVQAVTWEEAVEFCKRLTKKEQEAGRLSKDYIYRLPTEAEWEYATRAGSETVFFFGKDNQKIGLYAWYLNNSDNKPHPVGRKSPNDYGLHDVYGNVFEWCYDWYADYPTQPVDNYSGPAEGAVRVLRGGYYGQGPEKMASSERGGHDPLYRSPAIGFRVCLAPANSIPGY